MRVKRRMFAPDLSRGRAYRQSIVLGGKPHGQFLTARIFEAFLKSAGACRHISEKYVNALVPAPALDAHGNSHADRQRAADNGAAQYPIFGIAKGDGMAGDDIGPQPIGRNAFQQTMKM